MKKRKQYIEDQLKNYHNIQKVKVVPKIYRQGKETRIIFIIGILIVIFCLFMIKYI